MKKVLSFVAATAAVAAIALLMTPVLCYPMHFGEPTYFHIARCNCLVAAVACGLVSFVSAIVSVHF